MRNSSLHDGPRGSQLVSRLIAQNMSSLDRRIEVVEPEINVELEDSLTLLRLVRLVAGALRRAPFLFAAAEAPLLLDAHRRGGLSGMSALRLVHRVLLHRGPNRSRLHRRLAVGHPEIGARILRSKFNNHSIKSDTTRDFTTILGSDDEK